MAEHSLLTVLVVAAVLHLGSSAGQRLSSCDFGVPLSQTLCGWTQQNSISGWRFGSSCTPTSNTGPCTDHTGIRNGNFLYTESSYVTNGTRYRLNSPVLFNNVSFITGCLQLYYHMYGDDIGILNIYFNNALIWTRSGQQGDNWFLADVDFNLAHVSSQSNFNFSIEGVIVNNKGPLVDLRGDIAIDDISVWLGSCPNRSEESASTTYSSTITPPVGTTTAGDGFVERCSFDNGLCGFYNKRGANAWTISNGSSVADLSGPAADKTLSNATGRFVLFKTPLAAESREGSMLVSPRLGSGAKCLRLFYYIFGNDTGSFNVYADVDAEDALLWSSSGAERRQWLPAEIPLPNNTVDVTLEGMVFSGDRFFIAVDELLLTDTPCNDAQRYTCDFGTAESLHSCGYAVSGDSPMKWAYSTCCSLTPGTGPCADHTGNRLGIFSYIESSHRQNGTSALLNSPVFRKQHAAPGGCLQFYYHMYGEDIGTLNVYLNRSLIWSRTGERGNVWLRADVELNLTEAAELAFQISFEAVILNNEGTLKDLKGDIAIDDIMVQTSGNCEQASETPPPTATTPATPVPTDAPVSPARPCNFEGGPCGFFNKRQALAWIRANGDTAPSRGPQIDSTYGNSTGMFMYYDGRSVPAEGNSSILVSPRIFNIGCLNFNFYISGSSACTFNILNDESDVDRVVWSTLGPERDRWMGASVSMTSASGRISFEAVRDSGSDFVIAIDDVALIEGQVCSGSATPTAASAPSSGSVATSSVATTASSDSRPTAGNTEQKTTPVSGDGDPQDIVAIVIGISGAGVGVVVAALIIAWILRRRGKCPGGLPASSLSIKFRRNRGQDQAYLDFNSAVYSET